MITALIWTGAMFFLERRNFTRSRKRILDWRGLKESERASQVEYHNSATYKALELYVKVLLAVLGGIALIATRDEADVNLRKILIDAGGWIIVLLSLLFSFLVFAHQKSKIERWKRGFKWYEPLIWNECWFTASAAAIAIGVRFYLIPQLFLNI